MTQQQSIDAQDTSQSKTDFQYESFEVHYDFLQQIILKPGESTLVSIINEVPGMPQSVISNKEHYWAESGDKGRFITCHGGSCCETYTFDKWSSSKKLMNSSNCYYVPVVHYEPGKDGLTTVATVKVLKLNKPNFNKLVVQVNSCEEGTLPFFDRDVKLTYTKPDNRHSWDYIKKEAKALWLSDPVMHQSVIEQLEDYKHKLNITLPKKYTEAEFIAEREVANVKLEAKLSAAQHEMQQMQPNQYQPMQPNQYQPMQVGQSTQPMQQMQPNQYQPMQQPMQPNQYQPNQYQPMQQPMQPNQYQPMQQPIAIQDIKQTQTVEQNNTAQIIAPITATPVAPIIEQAQDVKMEEVPIITQDEVQVQVAPEIKMEEVPVRQIDNIQVNFDPSTMFKH